MRGFEPPISCVTGRRFKPLSYTVKVGGAGFEPAKVEPSDLQSDSFSHSEILPEQFMFRDRTAAVYGSGRARTDDLQVKSPLLYQLSYRPIVFSFQGAGGSLPPPTYVIYHRFSLWVVVGGHLRKCHRQQKRERNFLFPSPCFFAFFRLRLTYVYPY